MSDASSLVLLSVVNWLHLMATVTWIGAMITNALAVLPAASESLDPPTMGRFIGSMMKKVRRLTYISIIVLILTGGIMMTQNAQYLGLFEFGNLWTILLLVKHIFIVCLVVLAIYAFEVVAPKVGRIAAKGPSPELAQMQRFQIRLSRVGLIMGLFKKCNHIRVEVNRYYGTWMGLFGGGYLTRIVYHCDICDKYKERETPGHINRVTEEK